MKAWTMSTAAAVVLVAAYAYAQQPQQQQQQVQPQQRQLQPQQQQRQQQQQQPEHREANRPVIEGQATATAGSPDTKLAACLMIGNEKEIAMAKLAEERAKSDEVKKFAKQMVEDHTKFWQQLARFAPEGQRGELAQQGGSGNQSGAADQRGGQPGATASVAAGQRGQGGAMNFVQLKREMSNECYNLARRDLEEKDGSDFDKCYIGGQVGAHMEMLAALKVSQRHVTSPELRSLIEQGIETTESHLKHAKEIAKSLEKDSST